MPQRTIRLRAKAVDTVPLRPETFGSDPIGIAIPPGTDGLTKVTNPESEGVGHYIGLGVPPTSESAVRRLALPRPNRAEEVRALRTIDWVFGSIGTVAGSRTNDLQIEVENPEALEEVSRWKLPLDVETRLSHAVVGAVAVGAAGFALGAQLGNPWIGLLLGLIIGFAVGYLFPTDWGDLSSLLFGAADINLLLTLV